jgi:hypothetical protein
MATPDILTTKINHGFDHLDADGDGQLTEHDHVLMGQRSPHHLAMRLTHHPSSRSSRPTCESGEICTYRISPAAAPRSPRNSSWNPP